MWCNWLAYNTVTVEYRAREQKYCSCECSNEKKKKKKEFTLTCKCGNNYKVNITEKKYINGDYKKFCSRECANSRLMTDQLKEKISISNKNSEKVKKANIKIAENRRNKLKEQGRTYSKVNNSEIINYEFVCLYCGKNGASTKHKKNRKYHSECWLKASGGIRKGSSRGKSGWYKGYWCDSSYELAYLIYSLENNIKIERNTKGYEYIYKNEKHIYYPDFRVNNELVEIKNYRSDLTDIKLKSVDEKIKIYYKDTIKPYLDYVKNKYGKNFIRLYENGGVA